MYQELFEARLNEVRHDFQHANAGRGFHRPGVLRTLLHRLTTRS